MIFEIEKKVDTPKKVQQLQDKPTTDYIFANEFNKVASSYFGVFTDELGILRFVSQTGTVVYVNLIRGASIEGIITERATIYDFILNWIKYKNQAVQYAEPIGNLFSFMNEAMAYNLNAAYPNTCNCSEVVKGYLLSTALHCFPELPATIPFSYELDGSYEAMVTSSSSANRLEQFGMFFYLLYAAYSYRILGNDFEDLSIGDATTDRMDGKYFITAELNEIKSYFN
jgi:hypothetical protein